jgi:hypothetical protein
MVLIIGFTWCLGVLLDVTLFGIWEADTVWEQKFRIGQNEKLSMFDYYWGHWAARPRTLVTMVRY